MASEDKNRLATTYPTRPRLNPPSKTPNKTPESKYWKSFKTHQISNLISSITSLEFSPTHPHHFAATHSTSLSLFDPHHPFTPTTPVSTISAFKDTAFSASFRSDGKLIAAGGQSGIIQVFEATKSRSRLRQLKGHSRPVRFVKYPRVDRLHLFSGGDDGVVKHWDVATETCLNDFIGHKDYVRSGDCSPVDDGLFATGGYDHTVRVWDVRVSSGSGAVMAVNHGKPVEDVVYLPSGGFLATAGGNVVKIWDLIGGGRCVYEMESHNKSVTSLCVGKVGRGSGEESDQYRLMSVSLDGYLKVFDYSKQKITFSMRFPAPLLSVGFSPDCSTRVIGTSNGTIYMGKRKKEKLEESSKEVSFIASQYYKEDPQKRVSKAPSFRYFHRGQSEKPREGEHLVLRPKKVKVAEHDKLLKKFRHKDALVAAVRNKDPDSIVAVMEELVARKMLLTCVSNLDSEELGFLLAFLQRYTTLPRYANLLMPFAIKVVQSRAEDIRASDALKNHIKNLKRSIFEELRVQESLLEIQGVISPLMRIVGRK